MDHRAQPVLRPAVPQDADEVIRLVALMYESMGIDASAGEWREAAVVALGQRLGGDAAVFVAEDGANPGSLAACGAGTIARRLPGPADPVAAAGYIQWVSTDPAWRRRGLARQVMAGLLGWYERMGVGAIELHATTDGIDLYRSLGFVAGPYPGLRRRRRQH